MTESVPAAIYEVVDSSNETYWTLGVFPALAAAKAALDGCTPDDLPGDRDDCDDYCRVEVRERRFGWGGVGKTVHTCEWHRVYREADDEYDWQQTVPDAPANPDVGEPPVAFTTLMDIARRLRDQDNRCTHEPMFCVQQKRREVGFDPAYSSETVWINMQSGDYEEVPPETPDAQEFGYKDYWETVMVCFTLSGCQDYLKANGHNLKETRIYVESFSRCDEMIRIRHALLALLCGTAQSKEPTTK
jgi:hypothetical protein